MKMDELGKKLYDVLGGRENILQAYNCMTRLRVQLNKKDAALLEAVKQVPGVMGIHDTEEELQIILGRLIHHKVFSPVRPFSSSIPLKIFPASSDADNLLYAFPGRYRLADNNGHFVFPWAGMPAA